MRLPYRFTAFGYRVFAVVGDRRFHHLDQRFETPRRRAVISVVIAINPSLGIRSNRATKSARNIVACFPSLGLSFIRLGILFCDSLSVGEPRPRNGEPS